MLRQWQFQPKISPETISKFPQFKPVVLQLLFNRHLTEDRDIADFFAADYETGLHDPYLFVQMNRAIERIWQAIAGKDKVMVYGDYDADGVCATIIASEALRGLGLEVDTYIPFRETEGYGLNQEAVEKIVSQGFKLVVTVDCGVSNEAEIKYLSQHGVETIVLDHHQEPVILPLAVAIVNPSLKGSGYPFDKLCGAGVAFKFLQAIIKRQKDQDSAIKFPDGFDKWLLDLTALATIGDIVPLIGENRVIVKYGLKVLSKTRRLGLLAMMERANNFRGQLDTNYVGWRLVPRINAAGRINHASLAYDLLTAKSEAEAERLADVLEAHNTDRQQITDKILQIAERQIIEQLEKNLVLWAVGDDWPLGVVGLVAGRLCDKYHRPTLIVSRSGDKYTGSGRSIEEFDITAALRQSEELLARFGGHSQACGFTAMGVDNFLQLQERLEKTAKEQLAGLELSPKLLIEAEVRLADLNWQLLEDLEKFAPFGEDNPKPIFAVKGASVEAVQIVGADGKHLRLMISQEGSEAHKLIGFSFGEWCAKLNIGDKIDIAFELDVNEWNGNREIQLKIVDLKMSDILD